MNPVLEGLNYFNKAISQTLPRKIKVHIYSREERIPVKVIHE